MRRNGGLRCVQRLGLWGDLRVDFSPESFLSKITYDGNILPKVTFPWEEAVSPGPGWRVPSEKSHDLFRDGGGKWK